ncbi:NAD(P)-dependent dehydrogenase (short-subunit alcohol dehydrogenase family) [Streptomyces ambofaciens]
MADSQRTTHTGLFDLSGKYALVTGGTKGIGMMIARGLLQAGARVVVSSRSADTCAQAQRRLSAFGDVRAVPADLSTHDECRRLADLVMADSERLDVLVNNAGAMWREPLATFPDEGLGRGARPQPQVAVLAGAGAAPGTAQGGHRR